MFLNSSTNLITYSTLCGELVTSLSLSNDISLVNFGNIFFQNISLLVCFYLLARRLSLILFILISLFLCLVAHIQIEGDLLFGLWCYMDITVYQSICMYVCVYV
jgi:hypothetical protein